LGAIFTLEALVANAKTVAATFTSTHASSRAVLLTSTSAVLDWVGTVDDTTISRNGDITFSSASNRLTTYMKSKLGIASRTAARVLEAEGSLGASALGVKSTGEALGTSRSTEGLEAGESSIRISISIVAIVAFTGMNPLAVVRSSISRAGTTTTAGGDARSS